MIQGLHHVTAIAGGAQRNLSFYADGLGQRFVKKTVNFDDPGTYHLYYGDRTGSAGTVMTFFPWEGIRRGRVGAGQVVLTQYAVPGGSLDFWAERLPRFGAEVLERAAPFGAARLEVADPDGLRLALVEVPDGRAPWTTDEIGADVAVRGFHGVTLGVHEAETTARILTEVFGYTAVGADGRTLRFVAGGAAPVVDLLVDPDMPRGQEGAGTVHHVAFSVPDRAAQLAVRERMVQAGMSVTPQIDRTYFWAIYSRTPSGVLFEVATEEPGFAVDEDVAALGTALKLPPQHEPMRERIEAVLPALDR